MLLQRLKEYNDRLNMHNPVPSMYQKKHVPWLVELDLEGNLLGFASTGEGKKDKGKVFIVPHPGARTSNVKPGLLADKAEYVLGIYKDRVTADRQQSFVDLVAKCMEATGEKAVMAVYKFLISMQRDGLAIPAPTEIKPNTLVAFTVNGQMPSDLLPVQDFWRNKNTGSAGGEDHNHSDQCIICGSHCTPVSPHPVTIKPIPNGQTSGLAIVSANKAAFESYGLENSLIAPTCRDCAEAYAKGANELLRKDKNTSLVVGPLVYIFWTEKGLDLPLISLISQARPDPGQVKELLAATSSGHHDEAFHDDYFYAAALSANNARVAVRDLLETRVGTVHKNLARWFEMQRLVAENGGEGEPIGVYALAASLYRFGDASRQMTPNVPKVILEAALKGAPLPYWLLYQAVKRNKAEQKVTRTRLALIKMVILSKYNERQEDDLVELDSNNVNPAYLCGRLLAELENIQKAAIKPNITFVERFYATASSAPASVFGTLLRLSQANLAKLRKQKPGQYLVLQQRLEEIQSKIAAFPRVLKLEEQGLFALGYYHQRAYTRNQNRNQMIS